MQYLFSLFFAIWAICVHDNFFSIVGVFYESMDAVALFIVGKPRSWSKRLHTFVLRHRLQISNRLANLLTRDGSGC